MVLNIGAKEESKILDPAEEIKDLEGCNSSILITILSSCEDELGVLKSLSNVSYPQHPLRTRRTA